MSKYHHQLIFYYTITPLHVGCGQEVGLVDNPIIREKTTGFPFIPGSGIRGVLRDRCEGKPEWKTLFGPEPEEDLGEKDHAGCVSIHDAKILFFPVRTNVNLFHWITCPSVIKRFNRDLKYFNLNGVPFLHVEYIDTIQDSDEECFSVTWSEEESVIFLEEFPFSKYITLDDLEDEEQQPYNLIRSWIEDNNFNEIDSERVLVVSDHVFDYFVQHGTIVIQHNRLTSAKTVADGALFSVESVPPETLFYGIIGGTKARRPDDEELVSEIKTADKAIEKLLEYICKDSETHAIITLGGDESTGLGLTRMFWSKTNGQTMDNKNKQEGRDEEKS